MSRDHLGEIGGINLYIFVNNSPIELFDPFGLFIGAGAATAGASAVSSGLGVGAAGYPNSNAINEANQNIADQAWNWAVEHYNSDNVIAAAYRYYLELLNSEKKKAKDTSAEKTKTECDCGPQAISVMGAGAELLAGWAGKIAFKNHIEAAEHQFKYGLDEHKKFIEKIDGPIDKANHLGEVTGFCHSLRNSMKALNQCLIECPCAPLWQHKTFKGAEPLQSRCRGIDIDMGW